MRVRQNHLFLVSVIALIFTFTLTLGFKLRPQDNSKDKMMSRFKTPTNLGYNLPFQRGTPYFGMNDRFPFRDNFEMPFRDNFPFQLGDPFDDEFPFDDGFLEDEKDVLIPKGAKVKSQTFAEGKSWSSHYESHSPGKGKTTYTTTSWKYKSPNNYTSETSTKTLEETSERENTENEQVPLTPAHHKVNSSENAEESQEASSEESEEAEKLENIESTENNKTTAIPLEVFKCNYPDAYICQDSDRNKNISAACSTIGHYSCVCYQNGTCLNRVANKCYTCGNPEAVSIHEGDYCPSNCTEIQSTSSQGNKSQETEKKDIKKRLLF